MKLYDIMFDGQHYWVEAASYALAIVAWQWHVKGKWGDDYSGEEEPESVCLMHDESVIRSERTIAP